MWVATHETSGVVSTTAYEGNAGTSFSAPLAAGLAARYMEERFNTFQGRPTYKEVYDYLLQQNASSPTPPSNGTTGYPVCVEFGTGIHRKATEAEASSGICDSRAQYHFIQGAPHSNARMIHWNRTCP